VDRAERFYKIHRLLTEHDCVPVRRFLEELEISPATFKRDMEYMRSRMHAPIVWDRGRSGYCFTTPPKNAPRYELPGLWFDADEINALLTSQQLLEGIMPGVLSKRLQPLKKRLQELLGNAKRASELSRRIEVRSVGARPMAMETFSVVATALLERKRVFMRYRPRATDRDSEREVSPQRLIHYRENWYLDAWCHMRNDLRSFSMDLVRDVERRTTPALDVSEADLDARLGSGYGIYSGVEVAWAKLRFSPTEARWVAAERWHPRQRSTVDAAGHYILEVPYTDDRELLRDILKHGAEVEVLEPASLRDRVRKALREALDRY
jgi:predicted DNA-binding transcriptional regulator YafY